MANYEPLTLTSASLLWPGNSRFQYRLAYIGLKAHFGHTAPLSLEALLDSLTQDETSAFYFREDVEIIPQDVDIPYSWKRRPLRFFYGDIERPLAFYRKFEQEFLPFDELFLAKLGYRATSAFELALVHQDLLIERLIPLLSRAVPTVESNLDPPPSWFVQGWKAAQQGSLREALERLDEAVAKEASSWIGSFLADTPARFDRELFLEDDGLFATHLFVELPDQLQVPYPQFYLEALFSHFGARLAHFAETDSRIGRVHRGSVCTRTYDAGTLLATKSPAARPLPRARLSRGTATSEEITLAIHFDTDKLFLVEPADAIDCAALSPSVNDAAKRLSSASQLASAGTIVAVDGQSIKLPRNVEVFPLLLLSLPSLAPCSAKVPGLPESTEVLSLEDWQAVASHFDDYLDLVAFLRTLGRLRPETHLVATDFLDLVAWFRDSEGVMMIPLTNLDLATATAHWWSTSEAKELAEKAAARRILARLGLPDEIETQESEKGAVQIFDQRTNIGLSVLPIGQHLIVIHVCSADTRPLEFKMNRTFAETIVYHLTPKMELLSDTLNEADLPEIIHVWLHSEETVSASPGMRQLDRALTDEPDQDLVMRCDQGDGVDAYITLVYRDRYFDAFEGEHNQAERLLLQLLFEGLSQLDARSSVEPNSLVDDVLPDAPRAVLIESLPTGHGWTQPHKPQLPSKLAEIGVYTKLALFLDAQGIGVGEYEGVDAWKLVRTVLYEHLILRLDDLLAATDTDSAISRAYATLENAYAYLLLERLRITRSQSAIELEYDPAERLAELETLCVRVADACAMIIERALIQPRVKAHLLTRERWSDMLSVSSEAYALVLSSLMYYHDLAPLRLVLHQWQGLRIESTEEPALNVAKWRQAEASEGFSGTTGLRRARTDEEHPAPRSVTQALPGLDDVASAFREQFGYKIDDLLVTYIALSHHPIAEDAKLHPLVVTTRRDVIDWLSGAIDSPPSKAALRAVLRDLTFDASKVGNKWNPWERRSRTQRISMQVIVPFGKKILFGPWTAEHAGRVWLRHVEEGRLPLPQSLQSPALQKALQKYGQARNRQLERDLKTIADELDLPCEINVKKLEKLFSIKPDPGTGEIDALLAVPQKMTLYVLEAKDLGGPVTVADIASDLKAYFEGDKSYQKKLARKVKYARRAKHRILKRLGIAGTRRWKVQGAFVTRHTSPAAFAKAAEFPIFHLSGLRGVLTG